ncbi:hypothetical protein ATANTOWER_023658 [Ataeniobius toweri]|uniref:Uncharacterized protein n=1 Tax=Ataeniobius toweri TaxID=208326 RepID=A0ABU7BAZ8_9TELE|nr:hypothetical protein [Ataeniobius toweri]
MNPPNPPNRLPSGVADVFHVAIEVPQQNDSVLQRGIVQHPHQECQESWVLRTAARPKDETAVRELSLIQRHRNVTLSSTWVKPNMKQLSWGAISKPIQAPRLCPGVSPE